jgi:hypothetical protein
VPNPLTDTLEHKVASFLGTTQKPELPSVLEFPLYGEIERVFATGSPTAYMTYRLGRMMDPALYPNPYILPTFIDNHDVRRFLSITSPTGEDLLQALAFLFTVPGIPIIYYGTEQGFTDTRQAMFAGGYKNDTDAYNVNHAVYQRIKKLADLRKASPALMHGPIDVMIDNVAAPGPFAYRRTMGTETVLVLMNTAAQPALVAQMDTHLPAGSVLEVLHSDGAPPDPVVGENGMLTMVLPKRAVIIARTTGQTTTPTPPAATIAVATPIMGQTFTADTTFTGTVTPPATRLRLVLDGNAMTAKDVTVAGDGSWSVMLPVSSFPTGTFQHDVAFFAPDVNVATAVSRFTSDVVFTGDTYTYDDPVGDDTGPAHTYTYPTDGSFARQMDITGVKLEVGATTMNLNLTMKDFSTVWNPKNGFDHVYYNIFFQIPGQTGGLTVMPKLNASVPAGFEWTYDQFSGGFDNVMYTSAGAGPTMQGATAAAPTIRVDPGTKTIIFTYDRNNFGLATWSGVKIYISTWDFDGIGAKFRPLAKDAGPFTMGGGGPPYTPDANNPSILYSADPKIMDDLPPITIP